MHHLFNFLVRQKKLAMVFTISIVVLGFYALQSLQRDRFPAVDFETMTISTTYTNASPEDVELNVTNKIEDELKSVDGLEKYTSISIAGRSMIYITIEQDAKDKEAIKTKVRNAVNRLKDFPSEVKNLPSVEDINTARTAVLRINIADNVTSYQDTRHIVESLEKDLELVDGVANVNKLGYLDREIKIYLQPEKLIQYEISLDTVISAIDSHNVRYTAGDNNEAVDQKNIVVLEKYQAPQDVADIIVKATFDGPIVRIGDIATITDGYAQEKAITRINGYKGFILEVKKQEQADVIKTVDAIKEKINQLKKQLPESMTLFYTSDASKHVRNRLGIVINNGMLGLLLLLIVLGIFLSARTAFWVAMSLPVTLLGSVLLLAIFGETINLISLAAMVLVLGIVVDDSIIIAESIHRERQKHNSIDAVVIGVKKVIMPVVTTILTTIVAFSSMFMMTGTMGKFVYVMPLVVIFALVMSFLEVSLALPAHLAALKRQSGGRLWFLRFEAIFKRFIAKILRYRYWVVLIFIIVLLLSALFAVTRMSFMLFPASASEQVNMTIEVPIGTSLSRAEAVIKKVEKTIKEHIAEHLESMTINIANRYDNTTTVRIKLTPINERTVTARQLTVPLKEAVNRIEGIQKLTFSIVRPGPGDGEDIEISLISANDSQRIGAATKLTQILENISGVSGIDRDDKVGKPRILVELNHEMINRLNINFNHITTYLKAMFSGIETTEVRYGNEDVAFRVYLGEDDKNETAIKNTKIANKNGQLIDMSRFVKLTKKAGETDYNHYNGERAILVSASVNDKKTSIVAVNQEALRLLNLSNDFPQVRAVLGGGSKETNESLASFQNAFLLALAAMFLLLAILFNSYSQPLLVLSAIPFSVVGVIWAFFLHQEPLSFFSILGVLALIGVVVNDSLVLVNHLNHLRIDKNEDKQTLLAIITQGATDRLKAVVLTTLTTLAGILPLAYGLGGVDAFLKPMAMALGYGLVFATLMTLVLLPCLYTINIEIIDVFKKLKQLIVRKTVKKNNSSTHA